MTENQKRATAPLTSSLKLLQLLEEISKTDGPIGASELARRVGISRSMAHRQLVTLSAAGWLESDNSGSYSLTFLPVRLGAAALRHRNFDERISQVLSEAAENIGEGISLAALENGAVEILSRGIPRRNVHVTLAHGQRFDIHDSALGLILTGYATETTLSQLQSDGVELPNRQTLEKVRDDGYVIRFDEEFDPIEVLAVPVGRTVGNVKYGLSAHWPQGRAKAADLLSTLESVARTLEELTTHSESLNELNTHR